MLVPSGGVGRDTFRAQLSGELVKKAELAPVTAREVARTMVDFAGADAAGQVKPEHVKRLTGAAEADFANALTRLGVPGHLTPYLLVRALDLPATTTSAVIGADIGRGSASTPTRNPVVKNLLIGAGLVGAGFAGALMWQMGNDMGHVADAMTAVQQDMHVVAQHMGSMDGEMAHMRKEVTAMRENTASMDASMKQVTGSMQAMEGHMRYIPPAMTSMQYSMQGMKQDMGAVSGPMRMMKSFMPW